MVVAHPDDAECECAGTVGKWATLGASVAYAVCTDGAAGGSDPLVSHSERGLRRRREQQDACDQLRVDSLTFLEFPDGELVPSLALRRAITREIRRHRPDVVICQAAVRTYQSFCSDHPDHLAAGQATMDAVYPAAQTAGIFPELLDEGLAPHHVAEVWVVGTDRANHFEDISGFVEAKVDAFAAHGSQIVAGGEMLGRLRNAVAVNGAGHGVGSAEAFLRLQVPE